MGREGVLVWCGGLVLLWGAALPAGACQCCSALLACCRPRALHVLLPSARLLPMPAPPAPPMSGAYGSAEVEGLLGLPLTQLYEGNASALRVLGANGAACAWAWAGRHRCALPCSLPPPSCSAVAANALLCGRCCCYSSRPIAVPPPPPPSRPAPPPPDAFQLRNRALHVYAEKQRVPDFRRAGAPLLLPGLLCRCQRGGRLLACLASASCPSPSLSSAAPLSRPRRDVCAGGAPVEERLSALGALMDASHASCRDLYQCSSPELDALVQVGPLCGARGQARVRWAFLHVRPQCCARMRPGAGLLRA